MDALNAGVGLFGLLALGASVWIVKRQNDKAQAALRFTISNSTQAMWVAISETFIAHPNLRSFYYEDEADPPPFDGVATDERLRLNAISELLLDAVDVELRMLDDASLRTDGAAVSYLESYIHDAFHHSKVLTDYCLYRRNWYHDSIVALAEAAHTARKAGPRDPVHGSGP